MYLKALLRAVSQRLVTSLDKAVHEHLWAPKLLQTQEVGWPDIIPF